MDTDLLMSAARASETTFCGTSRPMALLEQFRIPHQVDADLRYGGLDQLRMRSSGGRLWWPAKLTGEMVGASLDSAEGNTNIVIFARVLPDDAAEVLLFDLGRDWRRVRVLTASDGCDIGSIWQSADGDVFLPFDPDEVILNYRSERYTEVGAGSVTRVFVRRNVMRGYYLLRPLMPRAVQISLRRAFARVQARRRFPAWPIENSLHDFFGLMLAIVASVADEPVPTIAPWPSGYRWALVLTHDVEHAGGWESREPVIELERARGVRSSWNLVPLRYEVKVEEVRSLQAEGFEVGVHGLYHDGRDLASPHLWNTRLPAIRDAARRWDAKGFRSPALHRRWEFMAMPGLDYDSSYPDSDPFEPQAGGCCTWLPFFIGNTVELPVTLSQDHTLFVILRQDSELSWVEKARYLRSRGGLALIDTHPDYLRDPSILNAYERFLDQFVTDQSAWKALPAEVSAWWRNRADSSLIRDGDGWKVVGPAAQDARVELAAGAWVQAVGEAARAPTSPAEGRTERVTMLLENNPYPQDIRVRQEAESLVAAGHTVEVIAPRGRDQAARERVNGVDVRRFRSIGLARQNAWAVLLEYVVAIVALHLAAVRALLRGSTVIHLHNPPDLLFPAGALFRLARRRVVFDHHDLGPELAVVRFGQGLLVGAARAGERLTFAVASHVVAANASHAEIAVDRGRMRPADVTVVRNGPEQAWTRLPLCVRPGRLATVRLVYLGTVADQDGVEEMAEVLALLRDRHPDLDVRLTVIGDGVGRASFEAALEDFDVSANVTITGWVPLERVPGLLADADICVDPAPATELNERSTMIKVAEYLALGKPVVAYDLLETRRTVQDAALLVPHGDNASFAGRIVLLANDPELRSSLAHRARERSLALTWDKSESALLAAYARLTANARSAGRR
jgi:glycosyltransferase involved in cell wall biosynthesis